MNTPPRPMTPAEEHRFREMVGRHFGDSVPADDTLRIDELARKCVNARPWEWEDVVGRHLEELEAARRAITGPVLGYLDAAPRLLAAPMPLEAVARTPGSESRAGIVYRRDLERLPTVMLLESQDGQTTPVTAAQFLEWGRRPSELFRVALRNVRSRLKVNVSRLDLGDGHTGVAIRSDTDLASACVYFLSRFDGTLGAVGSMIAVPNSRCVLAAPIDAAIHFQILAELLLKAALKEPTKGGPDPDIYFWDGKRFYLNAAKITGDPIDGSRKMLTGTP